MQLFHRVPITGSNFNSSMPAEQLNSGEVQLYGFMRSTQEAKRLGQRRFRARQIYGQKNL